MKEMNSEPVILTMVLVFLIAVILIVFILAFFYKLMASLNKSGGFPLISKRWPAELIPPGKGFSRQSIAMGSTWYKNCANLVVADEGLYISLGFPFSMGTLRGGIIPWGYLEYQKKVGTFWTNAYEYEIMMDEPIILTVMRSVAMSFPEHMKPVD